MRTGATDFSHLPNAPLGPGGNVSEPVHLNRLTRALIAARQPLLAQQRGAGASHPGRGSQLADALIRARRG